MKTFVILGILLAIASSIVSAEAPGAIWTTNGDCGDEQQDENQYAVGDVVYVNGNNFDEDTFAWDIRGQPGQASCDPGAIVADGDVVVGESGEFCFAAYTVLDGDCGEYKVTVGNKHDNYRVNDEHEIPEFGLIAGSVAIAGAIAGFVFLRRK
jgi:hypothetical protein